MAAAALALVVLLTSFFRFTRTGLSFRAAIRIAQAKFSNRTLTGDEVRRGFEHLQLSPERVKKPGAEGLFHSIKAPWGNHECEGWVTFQQ
ncbi:hypothetical protein [Pseudogemmobacter bohemicus]|uniref:hypothetical protein n=1 Tax=Pseudogemmobacter bohemicus TaxID=2250708 RepID=UPI0018E52092|nr:hypothetical protein [Pseudogemmobacter bohemicus]